MPHILFKRQFIDAIRRGDKTTTLRRWKSCRLSSGSRAFAPGVGWLKILSCEEINLKDLTYDDAQADGFASLSELLATLRQIYPNHKTDGRCWYRVVFRPEAPEPPPPHDARKHLARQIRADLDKAVRQSGSLFPL
ncbi:MAG: ASCH domain-containing protein [Tepidisphaeraceae bacterium]